MKCPRTYAHIRTKKIGHNWTVYRKNHTLSHSPMVQRWRSIRTRAQRDLKNLNHYTYACVHGKPGEQALSNTAFVCWIPLRQKPDSINVLLGTIEKGGNKVGTFLPILKEKPSQKSSERVYWGSWRIRTAVHGFADRWLSHSSKEPYFLVCGCKGNTNFQITKLSAAIFLWMAFGFFALLLLLVKLTL